MSNEEHNPYASPKGAITEHPENELSTVGAGINRRRFAFFSFGWTAVVGFVLWTLDTLVSVEDVHFLVPMSMSITGYVVLFVIFSRRFQNIGWNKWLGLQVLLPIVNVIAWFLCLILPPNYATSKQIDEYGRTTAIAIGLSCVLVIIVFIAFPVIGF